MTSPLSAPSAFRLFCAWFLLSALAARAASAPAPPPAFSWDGRTQGAFVLCLAQDRQGNVWVGTEGNGLWRGDPAGRWKQFTSKDGLGDDDIYSLACDTLGRVWAGTLKHGVSVFNGQTWNTYDEQTGLPGAHVVALAVCPADGAVWGATEAGLFRYAGGDWTDYTRADGLSSDAVNSLAFAPNGDVLAGTQADGIAVGTARGGYKMWRTVPGPALPPAAPNGAGLPTALVNCLCATSDGTLYAGTDAGLAQSSDNGQTWRYLRGQNWAWGGKAGADDTAGRIDNADVHAIEILPLDDPAEPPVRIHAGGGAVGAYAADTDFIGGDVFRTGDPIDVRTPHAAPPAVYQTSRWGSFLYIIPRLRPGGRYTVRLHLAEIGWYGPGRRAFDVSLNGQPVLTRLDLFAAAGRDKAVVRDFEARADGQGRLVLAFQGTTPLPSVADPHALREDYVTCLADAGNGRLLIGHRQRGLEVVDAKTGARLFPAGSDREPTAYVTALLPQPNGSLLLGSHGDGLARLPLPGVPPSAVSSAPFPAPASVSPLPLPAAPPTLAQLNALLKTVSGVPPDPNELQPKAVALPDDWATAGDWLGRYGRYWACFPALFHPIPLDYLWGAGWESVDYDLTVGPDHAPTDSLRYWMGARYTTDVNFLELPPTYLHSRILKGYTTEDKDRRDTSVDDHGEGYPEWLDGPDVYATVTVPPGLYTLSLYFTTRWDPAVGDRDFRLSVRPHSGLGLEDVSRFDAQPEWAHGRVIPDFPGVYKRFLVRGPTALTVQIARNHSWNTELFGAMLDLADETPPPYFGTVDEWETKQAQQEAQRQALLAQWPRLARQPFRPATSEGEAANRLFDALEQAQWVNSSWWATNARPGYGALLRWYAAQADAAGVPSVRLASRLGSCCYAMGQYPQWEGRLQQAGLKTERQVEQSLRWDGVTPSNSGLGNQVVTAQLIGKTASNGAAAMGGP